MGLRSRPLAQQRGWSPSRSEGRQPTRSKCGLHSLRIPLFGCRQRSVCQGRDERGYVGYELDDAHHAAYSRAPTLKEQLDAVGMLDWKFQVR